nr:hypothetical protein [Tanacetum cinerariifolium]
MSTREHEKRHRSRCSRSPRPSPSVFSRIRGERSRSPKQKLRKKNEACSKGWETEERVCPHAQIFTTNAPTRDIRKRSQKARIANVGIGNQDQRKRNQVGRKTTCPSRGRCVENDRVANNISERETNVEADVAEKQGRSTSKTGFADPMQ